MKTKAQRGEATIPGVMVNRWQSKDLNPGSGNLEPQVILLFGVSFIPLTRHFNYVTISTYRKSRFKSLKSHFFINLIHRKWL